MLDAFGVFSLPSPEGLVLGVTGGVLVFGPFFFLALFSGSANFDDFDLGVATGFSEDLVTFLGVVVPRAPANSPMSHGFRRLTYAFDCQERKDPSCDL